MNFGRQSVNFARSSNQFAVLGIFFLVFGRGANPIEFVGLCSIGLGVLLGVLSLFGVGRPAGQPYKAPWGTLSLGCAMLLLVGIGAMSVAVRGRAQADAPAAGDPATAPFIDPINGFRLDGPGEGWKILSPAELRARNETAVAGARGGPILVGLVFVEPLEPGFRIAGREQEVGEWMIDQIEVADKRVVFNRPDELDGQKAVRCQVVGKIARLGLGIRYEKVALIANGRLYRLTAFGPSDRTAEDGAAFRPFMAAFHVLPTEPPAAPPVPAAPSARK
jgi:hypothetical protein